MLGSGSGKFEHEVCSIIGVPEGFTGDVNEGEENVDFIIWLKLGDFISGKLI